MRGRFWMDEQTGKVSELTHTVRRAEVKALFLGLAVLLALQFVALLIALILLAINASGREAWAGPDHYNSPAGVDCTPVGCVSHSYLYPSLNSPNEYITEACDGAPDGDTVRSIAYKYNGDTVVAKDPDGSGGSCGRNYFYASHEPLGHRGKSGDSVGAMSYHTKQ